MEMSLKMVLLCCLFASCLGARRPPKRFEKLSNASVGSVRGVDVPKDTVGKKESCEKAAICYSDKECGSGKCKGMFVGKCDCSACVSLITCTDDRACGGFWHACNPKTQLCECTSAMSKNGFPFFSDALRGFCNVRECDGTSRKSCFGLPCNFGHCNCD